jgi:hypothetical protein
MKWWLRCVVVWCGGVVSEDKEEIDSRVRELLVPVILVARYRSEQLWIE